MKAIISIGLLILLSIVSKAQYNDVVVPSAKRDTTVHKKPRRGKDYFGIKVGYVAGLDYLKYAVATSQVMRVLNGFSVGGFHYYQQRHLILLQELAFTSEGGVMVNTIPAADSITGVVSAKQQKLTYTIYNSNLKILFGGKWKNFLFYAGPLFGFQMSCQVTGLDAPWKLLTAGDVLFEIASGVGYELPLKGNGHRAITFDAQFNQALLPTYASYRTESLRIKTSWYDRSAVLLVGYKF